MSNKQLLSIPPTLQWLTSNKQTFNTPGAAAEVLGSLDIIDQTKLPQHYERIQLSTPESIFTAIQTLAVRGAPAIGCAAALGLAACAQRIVSCQNSCDLLEKITKIAAYLDTSRPTAINLHWALQRCLNAIKNETSSAKLKQRLLDEALTIVAEDIKMCSQIGQNGLALLSPDCTVLTHCNAGALATAGIGTALAPIYAANAAGYTVRVYSDETRPLLQGARLTAWELNAAGIDTTTICDSMAAQLMQKKKIDIVIVGADRVTANGDAANKIGTYSLAINAYYHHVPFYIAMPYSTIDRKLSCGSDIPIEQRSSDEIFHCDGVHTYNPAFDVTPHQLITGYITEKGIQTKL